MNARIFAVLVAVSLLLACGDGQAGADYRGEPLMSMRGMVQSSSVALSSDLVPALQIVPPFEELGRDVETLHFVQGEVEGTFPSAFTLRIYNPPEPHSLQVIVEGEPAMAEADIVAVSPEHPAWLRKESRHPENADGDSYETQEICADTGECLTGDSRMCFGDEPAAPVTADPADQWPCGGEFPDDLPWETYGYSRGHDVFYLAEAAPAGGVLSRLFADGAEIASGYHVRETTNLTEILTAEELDEQVACRMAASEQALNELNEIHGTAYRSIDTSRIIEENPAAFRQYLGFELRAIAELGCRWSTKIIDTSETPVGLSFVDQPNLFIL